MVRPSGRRGDVDLGPVTDRTGRVEGCPMTASSRGVRGRHNTSDIPVLIPLLHPIFIMIQVKPGLLPNHLLYFLDLDLHLHPHLSHTPIPYEPYKSAHPSSHHTDTVYDPYLQAPTVVRYRIPYRSTFQEPILYDGSQARQDSSCSTHGYSHAEYGVSSFDHYVLGPADRVSEGSRNKRPDVVRDVPAPTQKRKKVKLSDWEQTEAAKGGPVDPELIPSYGGHVAGRICHGQDRGFNALELHAIATSRQTSQSHQVRAARYLHYILGSSLFSDKSGNIVPARLWPLLRDASRVDAKELAGCWLLLEFRAWIYLYFPMLAPPFRHSPK
ncbi:hypothetical protein M9H77_14835 [Catharanthus roseus]|uniref:Uncharacterized protein n=1 Tax=Catharanthus roseus TaxID=4058 RepID=A0ACC0BPH0_CATRO|nr:hypothetical protein M9H77_14835 [Catharanthus roseus]